MLCHKIIRRTTLIHRAANLQSIFFCVQQRLVPHRICNRPDLRCNSV